MSLNFLNVIISNLLLLISSKCFKKTSFRIFVEGYLFSLNLWYINEITPAFVLRVLIFIAKDLLVTKISNTNRYNMNFLSIDCSTDSSSLFIKIKNKTFIKFLQSDKLSNDLLMKKILDFIKENNLEIDDLSHIFVNQGPGNFSGLRGSIATAKGISLSKNLILSGYNTFIWSSSKFLEKEKSIFTFTKFREKYFFQEFSKNSVKDLKIQEVKVHDLVKDFSDKFKIFPKNIAHTLDEEILKLKNIKIIDPDHNDLEFLYSKNLLDKDLIKPLYLG